MSYISHKKDWKVIFCRVGIRFITAYLLSAQEFWQNHALALQFWCLSSALTLQVIRYLHLMHQNLSARALVCLNSLAKVNRYLLIYDYNWLRIYEVKWDLHYNWCGITTKSTINTSEGLSEESILARFPGWQKDKIGQRKLHMLN